MNHWIALAILGLILTFLALIIFWSGYRKKKRWRELGDTDTLRKALANWEPIVLERDKTLRGVKRFANRARFLTTDEPDDMIPQLVGFVALDEIGVIDYSMNELDFEQWKRGELRTVVITDSTAKWVPAVVNWLDITTRRHWMRYQALATGTRLESPMPDGDATPAPETTKLPTSGEE